MVTTDEQVRRLMKLTRDGLPLSTAAAKAGMDEKTARKYPEGGAIAERIEESQELADEGRCFWGSMAGDRDDASGRARPGSRDAV